MDAAVAVSATAVSSTSSDIPPAVFHPFDRSEHPASDDGGSLPCPLCTDLRRALLCADCVRGARFCVDGFPNRTVRFDELQAKLFECQRTKAELASRVKELLAPQYNRDAARIVVHQKRQHVAELVQILEFKKRKKRESEGDLKDLRESIDRVLPRKLKVLKEKLLKSTKHLNKLNSLLLDRHEKLGSLTEMLASLRRSHVQSLTSVVFPLEPDLPSLQQQQPMATVCSSAARLPGEPSGPDCVSDLVLDAARLSFESGRWHFSEENPSGSSDYIVTPLRIVHPRLPATGDYSELLHVVGRHHRESAASAGTPFLSLKLGSPVHEMAAGLAYTSQLVNILAWLLDVPLPYKVKPRRFFNCTKHSKASLAASIGRLNCNVIYMCCHQHIDTAAIHPLRTLHNLSALLSSDRLGSSSPFTLFVDLLQNIEVEMGESGEDSDEQELSMKEPEPGGSGTALAGGSTLAGSDEASEWDSLCDSDIAASAAHVAASSSGSPLAASATAPWSASTITSSATGSIVSSVFQGMSSWWRGGSNPS